MYCLKGGNGAGWASEDVAAVEDEEECRVTNIDEDTRSVQCIQYHGRNRL